MTDGPLTADGFDEVLIGFGYQFTRQLAVYDYDKCIAILERSMSHDDAVEYFEFNVAGAWVGEHTPVFVKVGQLEPDIEDEP